MKTRPRSLALQAETLRAFLARPVHQRTLLKACCWTWSVCAVRHAGDTLQLVAGRGRRGTGRDRARQRQPALLLWMICSPRSAAPTPTPVHTHGRRVETRPKTKQQHFCVRFRFCDDCSCAFLLTCLRLFRSISRARSMHVPLSQRER